MNHSIRARRLASFVLTAFLALGLPAIVEAEDAAPAVILIERAAESPGRLRLTPFEERELESVRAQDGWAKGLF